MTDDNKEGLGSRRLVLILATAFVLVVVGGAVSVFAGWWHVAGSITAAPVHPAGAAVRAYFGDALTDGSKLDRWTLVRVYDVRLGTIPVVLASSDGRRYQVDILKRDPAGPHGVADTTQLTMFIANNGDGGTSTPEEQGLGILQLAAALTARENAGAKPPALSSMNERTAAAPERQFAVPLD